MGWMLITLVFVAAVSIHGGEGCSCMRHNDLSFQYCNDERELILRGVAVNETVADDIKTYAFRITEVVKATGNGSKLIEGKNVINLKAGTESSMCGTSLAVGVEYVIVFGRSLRISLCDWIVPFDELEPWDMEVFEDEHFNCILRNCIPIGAMELMCCNESSGGDITCINYEECFTDYVEGTTHCCTLSYEGGSTCVDYPGFLKKK